MLPNAYHSTWHHSGYIHILWYIWNFHLNLLELTNIYMLNLICFSILIFFNCNSYHQPEWLFVSTRVNSLFLNFRKTHWKNATKGSYKGEHTRRVELWTEFWFRNSSHHRTEYWWHQTVYTGSLCTLWQTDTRYNCGTLKWETTWLLQQMCSALS